MPAVLKALSSAPTDSCDDCTHVGAQGAFETVGAQPKFLASPNIWLYTEVHGPLRHAMNWSPAVLYPMSVFVHRHLHSLTHPIVLKSSSGGT